MASIRSDALRNSRVATNLDSFRSRYRDEDTETGVSVIFPAYSIYAYDYNLFHILSECTTVRFDIKWTQRPDYASFEFYQTTMYWPLLLYVNQLDSMEDFIDLETILVPPFSVIMDIVKDKVPFSYIEELEKKTVGGNAQFYKMYPLDATESAYIPAAQRLQDEFVEPELADDPQYIETSEIYNVTQQNVDDKYIELSYVPSSASTLVVVVDDFAEPKMYGYDYLLVKDETKEYRRLTWDGERCAYGDGMDDYIDEVGIKIEVSYIYSASEVIDICESATGDVLIEGGVVLDAEVPEATWEYDPTQTDEPIVDGGTF